MSKQTFQIETLGCKVNEYESAYYTSQLEEAGFLHVDDGQVADVIIINTCTVTNTAAAKSRRKVARLKRENPGAFVVMVGCMAQVTNAQTREALGVDLIVGASHKNELAQWIQKGLQEHQPLDLVESIEDLTEFESMPIGTFEGQHRAFLKIQDGCNQYCSYCQIPLARGPERSQTPDEVIKSAQNLAANGHLEIVLTGIHTGRYHFRDTNLTDLLRRLLEEVDDQVCFRLSSIEITEITDELLELMKNNSRLLPHLHIPIQAGDDRTLARMKRPYTVAQFEKGLEEIRQAIPSASISTDIMTGFVQESDEEFETTVQTLKDCAFSFLHVFPYSVREGTAASKMTGFVDGNTAKERTHILLDLSKDLRDQDMARFTETQMLVERKDPHHEGSYIGYTSQYHPARLYSDTPVQGRLNVRIVGKEDDTYIVQAKED